MYCVMFWSSVHTIFNVLLKTACACSRPLFRPKKSSSSSSNSCMVSKRMLMVSTSSRGSRILERNLLAPPGVFVWLSTPKRVCSLLYKTKQKQRQNEHIYHYKSTTHKVDAFIVFSLLSLLPVVSIICHQLQVSGRCWVNHNCLFTPFKNHFKRLGSVDRVLDEL